MKHVNRPAPIVTHLSNPSWQVSFTKMVYILDLYLQFPDDGMKLFLETKKRIGKAVEHFYDFDPSRSSVSINANRELASALLRDRSFVYFVDPSLLFFISY